VCHLCHILLDCIGNLLYVNDNGARGHNQQDPTQRLRV
jgi:hypothetical protein